MVMAEVNRLGLKPYSARSLAAMAKRKPPREKMLIEMERAYRASNQYQVDKLLNLERRYNQRRGMAEAGLRKTRAKLQKLLTRLCHEKMGDKYNG
jgi:hypothetical protein